MSTLRVDNLQGQTADGISKYLVQYHYNTPASGSNLTDFLRIVTGKRFVVE